MLSLLPLGLTSPSAGPWVFLALRLCSVEEFEKDQPRLLMDESCNLNKDLERHIYGGFTLLGS